MPRQTIEAEVIHDRLTLRMQGNVYDQPSTVAQPVSQGPIRQLSNRRVEKVMLRKNLGVTVLGSASNLAGSNPNPSPALESDAR